MTLNSMNISIIKRLLGGKNSKSLHSILLKIEAADLTQLFNILNDHEERHLIDALIAVDKASDTLIELPDQQLKDVFSKTDQQKILNIILKSQEDDATHFLNLLEEEQRESILTKIPEQKRGRLRQLLNYPEESAGRMMTTQVFTLPIHLSAQEAIEKIRTRSQEDSIYYIYCVDENKHLMGVLSLRELVGAPAHTPLQNLIKKEVVTVSTQSTEKEVAQLVSHYDFIAVPVVDEHRSLKGIITVDDVVDIIQEQATADIYASAGLQEDDKIYSSVAFSLKNRVPWILLNLLTASIAGSVMSAFEETMNHLIILAALSTIVSGVSGNTGTQSLTVVTRGLAIGDFNFTTYMRAILKEVSVGALMGIIVGICSGLLVYFWKDNLIVAVIICITMILNSIMATLLGCVIPLALKRLKVDPASGSGVLLTFITDSFGFFTFLGIATLALKYFA
ncbi:MAG: magnesium transporter [Bdellovibrionota bacterium]